MTFSEYYAVVSEDVSSAAFGPSASDGDLSTGVTQSDDMRVVYPLASTNVSMQQSKKKKKKSKKKLKEDFVATTKGPVKIPNNKPLISLSSKQINIQSRNKPERIAV